MGMEEKAKVAALARTLIGVLEECDDTEFVDLIIACIQDGYDDPIRAERWT